MAELLKKAVATLNDLNELTRNGDPDPVSVLKLQSDLVKLYMDVGVEKARKFNVKESTYLRRKIAHAEQYQAGRVNGLKSGEADHAALLAIGEENQQEIDAATEWELYGAMLRSIQNAIEHSRQVVSFFKRAESHPEVPIFIVQPPIAKAAEPNIPNTIPTAKKPIRGQRSSIH